MRNIVKPKEPKTKELGEKNLKPEGVYKGFLSKAKAKYAIRRGLVDTAVAMKKKGTTVYKDYDDKNKATKSTFMGKREQENRKSNREKYYGE